MTTETEYLQSTEANKARLEESFQQAKDGKLIQQPINIDRASKEALKKIITDQHSNIVALENKLIETDELYVLTGVNLINEPFIPEYLGFSTNLVDLPDDTYIRTYNRDGYILIRDGDYWCISTPSDSKSIHAIDNMLEGTVVLKSLGVEVSILDVVMCKYVS